MVDNAAYHTYGPQRKVLNLKVLIEKQQNYQFPFKDEKAMHAEESTDALRIISVYRSTYSLEKCETCLLFMTTVR